MIDSFNNGPFTVTRTAAGTFALGMAVSGSTSALTVDGSLQQLTPRERALLPEGMRSKETKKLYTGTLLKGADEAAGTPPDTLVNGGITYQVVGVEDWGVTGIPHYKVILLKLDGQEGTRS